MALCDCRLACTCSFHVCFTLIQAAATMALEPLQVVGLQHHCKAAPGSVKSVRLLSNIMLSLMFDDKPSILHTTRGSI